MCASLLTDGCASWNIFSQADLGECRESVAKLNRESKNADDITEEWKRKEAKWLEERKALEAESERLRELAKKKSAADEVSNNGDEGKIDAGKGNEAVIGNEAPKAGAGVVPAPVIDKNMGSGAAAAGVKAKDEIGVLPET